jgi:hypothetical protein
MVVEAGRPAMAALLRIIPCGCPTFSGATALSGQSALDAFSRREPCDFFLLLRSCSGPLSSSKPHSRGPGNSIRLAVQKSEKPKPEA